MNDENKTNVENENVNENATEIISDSTISNDEIEEIGGNNNNVDEIKNPKRFRVGQGCGTFICLLIIIVVIFCKIKGLSFQDLTDDFIEYDNEIITSTTNRLNLHIYPIHNSYTGVLESNDNCMIINCAENFYDDEIQNLINNHYKIDELFLLSDVTYYAGDINTDSVHASSVFANDIFCDGEYTENEINLFGGKLRYLMKDDILNIHYTDESGDTFRVELSNADGDDLDQIRDTDVLINSRDMDLSEYADKTYLDNNNVENYNLSDYRKLTIDLLTADVTAVLK